MYLPELYLYKALDAAIEPAIERLKTDLPPVIERFHYELGLESEGEPAIWVWLVFQEQDWETHWTNINRNAMRTQVRQVFQDAGFPYWVYIRFRVAHDDPEISRAVVTVIR